MHIASPLLGSGSDSHLQDEGINYGRRLIPHIIDEVAARHPDHLIGMTAKSADISQGFNYLNMGQLANGVNVIARWIDIQLGPSPHHDISTPIAYIGTQDFRYWVMQYAAVKTGHPLLLPSTKNAVPNTVSLLEATKCSALFYAAPFAAQANSIVKAMPSLSIFQVPTLDEMVSGTTKRYSYTKTYEEAKDDPVLILHTSGSTGAPKPIFYTNAVLSRIDMDRVVPAVPGHKLASFDRFEDKLTYLGTPLFHLSGVGFGWVVFFLGAIALMGPPDAPATGRMVCGIVKAMKPSCMVMVPSLCDSVFMEHGEEIKESLDALETVLWLGGPLAQATGDYITKNTSAELSQFFGSTETLPLSLLIPNRSHWQYLEFHPTLGPMMEPLYPNSDLYEVVIHRTSDPEVAWINTVFKSFPHLTQWRTKDILRKMEGEGMENLWKFEGRLDDQLILSTALKVNPLHIEMQFQVHPLLKGCLVFGTGYPKCGMLLEPKDASTISKEELVEAIWEDVERANALVPEHARIERNMIRVTEKEKPFIRASKGTFVRSLTNRAYEVEINELYRLTK